MSPRVKRSRRELPKAMVQKGVVGSFPIHAWTLSALYQERCASIIGFRDAEETLLFKMKAQLSLAGKDKTQKTLILSGKIFNGFSDAFYRGHLPEVILVCLSDEQQKNFLLDFADYLGQLVAMGFLGGQEQQPGIDPVALHVPCFVLLGQGVWHGPMQTFLQKILKDLAARAFALTPQMQEAILNRFMRGSIPGCDWETHQVGFEVDCIPADLHLAGGCPQVQSIAQGALHLAGWNVELHESGAHAAERLELQELARRLTDVVIPGLAAEKRLSTTEAKELVPLVQQAILTIGCHRQAFTQSEAITLTEIKLKPKNKASVSPKKLMTGEEHRVLANLSAYATALGLTQEKALFDRLAACCQKTT